MPSQTQRPFIRDSNKKWIASRKEKNYCFRRVNLNHFANQCRDPIRCFACEFFGHKSKGCLKKLSFSDSSPKLVDHGFQFVLKCMLLKGILLDHLWHKRDEGINYLEDLLYHFDIINALNIGKDYKERFGNLEEYFGKPESSFNNSDSSKESLVDSSIFENSAADL